MREILYRGKRIDNGDWVFGYYCPCVFGNFPAEPAIIDADELKKGKWAPVKVTRETVSEYTGLTDKNGKKIFEGDIVQYDKDGATYEIVFAEDCGVTKFCSRFIPDGTLGYVNQRRDKVIGNRWDNPELLEVEK